MAVSTSRYRVIICDLGNVFINVGPLGKTDFFANCRVAEEEMKIFFARGEEFMEYERGKITREQFFGVVKRRLGYTGDYKQFLADFCGVYSFNKEIYDLLFGEVKMANDVEFWLLSNLNEFHYEDINKRWPGIFSSCRHVFLSFKLGLRKPEPEIWPRILKEGGAGASECLLLDDLEENCLSACEEGIASIVFNGVVSSLREELKNAGLVFEKYKE